MPGSGTRCFSTWDTCLSEEPFRKYFSQGYIQAPAFTDERGQYVEAERGRGDPRRARRGGDVFTWQGQPVKREFGKVGKSLKNMISPDDMYEPYGADTLRIYEMSMGPLELSKPWETRAVVGSARFLQRLWRNVVDEITGECGWSTDRADLDPALRTFAQDDCRCS
jgi:leucyl-tRNA synthetase